MNDIPYGKQLIDDSDIKSVERVFQSDFLTTGPTVQEFEKRLCEISSAKYAVACSNGTAALHLACLALEISNDDLALTTPLTFLASANCVEYCGGKVDFVDINAQTLSISVDKLEEYCKTVAVPKVVIPVDFTGIPADLVSLRKLSIKYGFKIIEDAAHAIGSIYTHEGQTYKCGSCAHSDLAIFSFHPVKTITTGEGGAIMTNDKDLYEKLLLYRNHGMTKKKLERENEGEWYYEMHFLGYNYRITDLQCALGLSQLNKLSSFKKRRKEIFNMYIEALMDVQEIDLPYFSENYDPCFHLFVIQFKDGQSIRRDIYNGFKEKNIYTQVHYFPVHLQPYYMNKYAYREGKCLNAETYYNKCLSLPLYPLMTDKEVFYVIDQLKNLLANRKFK